MASRLLVGPAVVAMLAAGCGAAAKPKPRPKSFAEACVRAWNSSANATIRTQFMVGATAGSPAAVVKYRGEIVPNAAVGSAVDPALAGVSVFPGACLVVSPPSIAAENAGRFVLTTAIPTIRFQEFYVRIPPEAVNARLGYAGLVRLLPGAARNSLAQDGSANSFASGPATPPPVSEDSASADEAPPDEDPPPKADPRPWSPHNDLDMGTGCGPPSGDVNAIEQVYARGVACSTAHALALRIAKRTDCGVACSDGSWQCRDLGIAQRQGVSIRNVRCRSTKARVDIVESVSGQ